MSLDSLEVKSRLKEIKTTLVVKSPAVIQAAATTTSKIFFLTRRCLNGRNVVSVFFKEVAVRFSNDANGRN